MVWEKSRIYEIRDISSSAAWTDGSITVSLHAYWRASGKHVVEIEWFRRFGPHNLVHRVGQPAGYIFWCEDVESLLAVDDPTEFDTWSGLRDVYWIVCDCRFRTDLNYAEIVPYTISETEVADWFLSRRDLETGLMLCDALGFSVLGNRLALVGML